jgi:hypothetical protein
MNRPMGFLQKENTELANNKMGKLCGKWNIKQKRATSKPGTKE